MTKKKPLTAQQSVAENIRWIKSVTILPRDIERPLRLALRGAHLDGREFELAKFRKDQDKRIRKAARRR